MQNHSMYICYSYPEISRYSDNANFQIFLGYLNLQSCRVYLHARFIYYLVCVLPFDKNKICGCPLMVLFSICFSSTIPSLKKERERERGNMFYVCEPNDTHREKLCFTRVSSIRLTAWLLLTFFICLQIN